MNYTWLLYLQCIMAPIIAMISSFRKHPIEWAYEQQPAQVVGSTTPGKAATGSSYHEDAFLSPMIGNLSKS